MKPLTLFVPLINALESTMELKQLIEKCCCLNGQSLEVTQTSLKAIKVTQKSSEVIKVTLTSSKVIIAKPFQMNLRNPVSLGALIRKHFWMVLYHTSFFFNFCTNKYVCQFFWRECPNKRGNTRNSMQLPPPSQYFGHCTAIYYYYKNSLYFLSTGCTLTDFIV